MWAWERNYWHSFNFVCYCHSFNCDCWSSSSLNNVDKFHHPSACSEPTEVYFNHWKLKTACLFLQYNTIFICISLQTVKLVLRKYFQKQFNRFKFLFCLRKSDEKQTWLCYVGIRRPDKNTKKFNFIFYYTYHSATTRKLNKKVSMRALWQL